MRRISQLILTLFFFLPAGFAQVSYGGKPLPYLNTRSMGNILFEDMPEFDIEEQLKIDSLDGNDLRNGYRFAYKFITNYNRSNSGTSFTLDNGTRVWRLGIRSKDALSINVLFTDFELPEGASLFLYNPSQSHIKGSFTHMNNSDLSMFPVSPVIGDELIIEYHEPANAAFPGRLTVGEVNHAYRSTPGKEPVGDYASLYCMDPVSCFPDDPLITDELARSVVLLVIDGTTFCSGVMVNNTQKDGKPYLLTASHCINKNFFVTEPEGYEKIAGSIVCYFNYNSPLCKNRIRGTEEMSVASTRYLSLNEKHDMALLELLETPPSYYQPYYAGWNLSEQLEPPYFAIHHPMGTVKRVNWMDNDIKLDFFEIGSMTFEKDAHWFISEWTAGCTAGGSSGSPLFDKEGNLIGALSGGYSACGKAKKDYYFAISRTWMPDNDPAKQLKHWLDPKNTGSVVCSGLDPYKDSPAVRLSNVRLNGGADNTEVTTIDGSEIIPLFGNNPEGIIEYCEEYYAADQSELHGVYLVTPAIGKNDERLKVEICVYEGTDGPESLIGKKEFKPMFQNMSRDPDGFIETEKPLNRAQESFILFDEPIPVKGPFYVGYRIVSAPEDIYFTALNLKKGISAQNTTHILTQDGWVKATDHPGYLMSTSLFIDPVIESSTDVANESVNNSGGIRIIQSSDRSTLYIHLPDNEQKAYFSLIDPGGKILQKSLLKGKENSVNIGNKNPGIYFVKIDLGTRQYTRKILF